jgi:hypothetical protein
VEEKMIAECVSSVNPRKEEFEGRVKEVEPFSATVREISTKQGLSTDLLRGRCFLRHFKSTVRVWRV